MKEEHKHEAKSVPARVFAITQADVAANPSVVTCQLLVNNSYFNVLNDSGATHSYVVSRVINQLGRPYDFIERGFGILLPSGEGVISKRKIRSMPIRVENKELSVNLVELELTEFDIILRMDFLSNGFVGLLAVVIDSSRPKKFGPKNVRVVKEFLDVFPKESPRLSPQREIYFVIGLAPRVEPVSKALYKMAPTKLKELKIKLQGMLDLGFI
uniref:Uncharacterized protein n=1 Tax=Cannabis sativa TaxID=3483 RepID=A0A803PYF4_CANSA